MCIYVHRYVYILWGTAIHIMFAGAKSICNKTHDLFKGAKSLLAKQRPLWTLGPKAWEA